MVTLDPPSLWEEEDCNISRERASPAHFFRNLVASGWRTITNQEMGMSSIMKGHVSRGHMPCLNRRSF